MRFIDYLRREPVCFNAKTDRHDFDASPLIEGATVFEVGEIAGQLIDSVQENPDGSLETILTAKGKELLKFRTISEGYSELAVDQYVGIIPPFHNCFFEWPTPFEPDAVDCGVLVESMSKQWIKANVHDESCSFALMATIFHRYIVKGVSVSAREGMGLFTSDSEGQLLSVKVLALLPPGVDRSLPINSPQPTPILVVLVALMMLNCKFVKSTLSPEVVKTRQQRRFDQRNPSRVTPPFARYYTLSIDPERTQGDGCSKTGGWEMAWHKVRGFLRHLKSGKVVPVRPHSRGNPLKGVILKDYEVKAPSTAA